jgi:hypothetical protein
MPTYAFYNKETGELTEKFMSFSERDKFLEENPHMEQRIAGAPAIGDSVRMGMRKPDASFRDLLKHVSKRAGRRSTIKYD